MRDFWQVVCIIAVVVALIPSILILGVWTVAYGVLLVPLAFLAFMIYRVIKNKGWLGNTQPPDYATPCEPKEKKKPRMIKWQDKEIPLGVAIFSIITAIILTPTFIICLLFIFPPVVSACILGFMVCKKIGSRKGQPC